MKRLFVYAAILAAGLLLLGALVMMNTQPTAPPSGVPLAKGSELVVEKVSYGDRHHLEGRVSEGFFPFMRRTIGVGSQENSLVVFLSEYDPKSESYQAMNWLNSLDLLDEHGCQQIGSSGGRSRVGDAWVQWFQFRSFPRREKTALARAYDAQGKIVVQFEIEIPEEARSKVEEWSPETLPISKSVGKLTATMTELRVYDSGRGTRNNVPYTNYYAAPSFKFEYGGQPTDVWQVGEREFLDATGNRSDNADDLCREEEAWKMVARFYRSEKANFAPAEIWKLGKVGIPSDGEAERRASAPRRMQGLTFEFLAVAGPGTTRYPAFSQSRGYGSMSSSGSFAFAGDESYRYQIEIQTRQSGATNEVTAGTPHVCLLMTGPSEDFRVSLFSKNSDGETLLTHDRTFSVGDLDNGEERKLLFWFLDAEPGETLDLDFVVQKYREMEFFVEPPKLDSEKKPGAEPRRTAEQIKALIPERERGLPRRALDLTAFYNAPLDRAWHAAEADGNDLAEFGAGTHALDGVTFDARGVIQLSHEGAMRLAFPEQVTGIPASGKASRIHFLHSAGYTAPMGTEAARYHVRYADGERETLSIRYGRDVMDWWARDDRPKDAGPQVAWEGGNARVNAPGSGATGVQLFRTSWENPRPDVEITSIDLESTMSASAPFILAITLEE